MNTIEINLRREFNTLKKHPNYTIFDANSEIHDYLNAKNVFNKERRKEAIVEAQKELIKELTQEMKRATESHKTIIRTWIKDIDKALDSKPIMQKKYFIKVKHYILADYLRDCVKQKKTFENIASNQIL